MNILKSKHLFFCVCGLAVTILLLPVQSNVAAAEPSVYETLVSLFQEFRDFQQPKLIDGVPDYTVATMKWQKEGLSLERIKELLTVNPEMINALPARSRKPGDISVSSHVFIDDGIEVQIDPSRADMTPEELRSFIEKVSALYQQVKNDRSKE